MRINLRRIREDDCYDLWVWRNHPQVRKWSFNTEIIDYDEHKACFAAKIKDKRAKMYIAGIERG